MNNQSYTASSVTAGMQCPMLYKIKYVLGYRSDASSAMKTGTLVHKGLEQYWLWKPIHESINTMYKLAYGGDEIDWWESDEGQIAWAKCTAYIRGYYKKYRDNEPLLKGVPEGNHVDVYVEREFSYDWLGITYQGKIDLIIHDHITGEVVIMDHKTTGSSLAGYFDRLPLDVQLTLYRQAVIRMFPHLSEKGTPLPRVFYDVIGTTRSVPKQKNKAMGGKSVVRRKDETDEELAARKEANQETIAEFQCRMALEYTSDDCEKYVRREIVCTSAQHCRRLIEIEDYVKLLEDKGFLEIRNSTSCGNYGGCAFVGVCVGRESLDDLHGISQSERKHPELSGSVGLEQWVSFNDPSEEER